MQKFLIFSFLLHLGLIYLLYSSEKITLTLQRPSIVEVSIAEQLPPDAEVAPTDLENENIIPNASEKVQKSNGPEIKEMPVAVIQKAQATRVSSVSKVPNPPPSAISSLTSTDLGIKTRYPRLSRMMSEEGKVIVIVSTDSRGNILKMSVTHSSGFERLDQAALEALSNLKRELPGKNTQIKVSFLFRLK